MLLYGQKWCFNDVKLEVIFDFFHMKSHQFVIYSYDTFHSIS